MIEQIFCVEVLACIQDQRLHELKFLDREADRVLRRELKALGRQHKVLKMKPGDYTVLKNIILLARSEKNIKLEKKYLPQLIKATSDETERASYEVRLKSLAGKS